MLDYIILILLLFLSAFFSGSETAFMSLKVHRKNVPNHLKLILKDSKMFLTSVLSANTIVNISIAVFSTYLTRSIFEQSETINSVYLWIIEILVVGFIILLFGEILPKRIAVKNPLAFAQGAYYPLRGFLLLITPFTLIINGIIKGIMFLFPFIKKEKVFDTEEELKIVTELGEEEGTIHEDESEMIQSVLEFDDKKKTIKSLNLDDFSVEDLKEYINELTKELERVKLEIIKKNKLQSEAEKLFK